MNLEAHLIELPVSEAAAFRAVAGRLRAAPEREPSADLTARILDAVDAERSRRRRRRPANPAPWWGAVAAAAGLIAAVTLFRSPAPSRSSPAAPPETGLAWLAGSQEPDGAWDPLKHGGAAEYRSALTALSALALARAPDRYAENVRRACGALAAQQTADGAFGGAGRSQFYNQAITTYALAALSPQRPELKPVLERAIGFVSARQSAQGGWDYEAGSEGNAALTAWQVRALACAAEQGCAGADIPLRRGLRWLRGSARDDGSVAYHRGSGLRSESLTALAAYALITAGKTFPELPPLGQYVARTLTAGSGAQAAADCYRDYAKVLALDAAGAEKLADAVRGQMLRHQTAGAEDQWGAVGGRLYTTALTALAAK